MDPKRRRWLVFTLGALFVVVAVAAVAAWMARSRQREMVPIVVADAAALVKSDLVLFSPRLPFPIDPDSGPPDRATLPGKTVLSLRGAERARAVAGILKMAVATPSMSHTGVPQADALFYRLPIRLKADEYELLRYNAEGRATRLSTQDVSTVVIKEKSDKPSDQSHP